MEIRTAVGMKFEYYMRVGMEFWEIGMFLVFTEIKIKYTLTAFIHNIHMHAYIHTYMHTLYIYICMHIHHIRV